MKVATARREGLEGKGNAVRLAIVIVCALALAGCAGGAVQQVATEPPPPPPKRNLKPADAMAEARKEAIAKLKDPESARFTDVVYRPNQPNLRGEPTDVVCGKINAKNSYGGYVGARPFVYLVDARLLTMSESAGDVGTVVYGNLCAGGA